jgi:hypothetical protein
MNQTRVLPPVLVAMAWLAHSTSAMDLSAVTLFGCDDRGVVDSAFRTNSGPLDAAWDVFLHEGPVCDPASVAPDRIQGLNDRENHTIKVPLAPGTHTFTLHSESARAWLQLMEARIAIAILDRPGAAILTYKKVD